MAMVSAQYYYLGSIVAKRVVESHGKVWSKRLPQLFLPKNRLASKLTSVGNKLVKIFS